MPTRLIREGINSSPRINALSLGAELLYRRLMSVVDDYGRFHAAPLTVLGACWPTCPGKVTPKDILGWLGECSIGVKPLLSVYTVDGAQYLQLADFGQPVRTKSKYPSPPESNLQTDCVQSESNLQAGCTQNVHPMRMRIRMRSKPTTREKHCSLENCSTQSRSVSPDESGSTSPAATGTRFALESIPDDWTAYARDRLHWTPDRIAHVFESFRLYWIAKAGAGGRKANWYATWQTWCRREDADHHGRRNGHGPPYQPKQDFVSDVEDVIFGRMARGDKPL